MPKRQIGEDASGETSQTVGDKSLERERASTKAQKNKKKKKKKKKKVPSPTSIQHQPEESKICSAGTAETVNYNALTSAVAASLPASPSEDLLDSSYSSMFFTLANAPRVSYETSQGSVSVAQNVNAVNTTGGIVWESCYLLLDYMRMRDVLKDARTFVDVGSGTGILGIAAKQIRGDEMEVTLTEAEAGAGGAMDLLQSNVRDFNASMKTGGRGVAVAEVDWKHCDMGEEFDFVTGTDVIFSKELAEPLLNTLSLLTKASTGVCYLCCQVRCEEAHEHFFSMLRAGNYFNTCEEVSQEVWGTEGCQWGRASECRVWRMCGGRKRRGCDKSNGNNNDEKIGKEEKKKKKKKKEEKKDKGGE